MSDLKSAAVLGDLPAQPNPPSSVATFVVRNGTTWLAAIVLTLAICQYRFEGAWSWGHFDSRFWILVHLDDDMQIGFKPRLIHLGSPPLHLLRGVLVFGLTALIAVISGRHSRNTPTPDS